MLGFGRVSTLYFQMTPQFVIARDVDTQRQWSDSPYIALSRCGHIKAIGSLALRFDADFNDYIVCMNPFDVEEGVEAILMSAILEREMEQVHRGLLRPNVILHPLESDASKWKPSELRCWQELAHRSDGVKTYVWTGRVLLDVEARQQNFPLDSGILAYTCLYDVHKKLS